MTNKIVVATSNPGKLAEFQALLQNGSIQLILQDANMSPIEETGSTFIENALIKARHAAHYTPYPVLADDSGLVIPTLQGAPGIHSARYAGATADAKANQDKLLAALSNKAADERQAYFYCCLVYLRYPTDPIPLIAEGSWQGYIALSPQGEHGFGYDPIFYLPTLQMTAAQLTPAEKNHLSHRGQALSLLKMKLAAETGVALPPGSE